MPRLNTSFWIAFALGIAAVYVWGFIGARIMTAKSSKGGASS